MAGYWLLGAAAVGADGYRSERVQQLARTALTGLRARPPEQQLARVTALREAALACRTDLYEVLTGG